MDTGVDEEESNNNGVINEELIQELPIPGGMFFEQGDDGEFWIVDEEGVPLGRLTWISDEEIWLLTENDIPLARWYWDNEEALWN
jgi:hypothetical protein